MKLIQTTGPNLGGKKQKGRNNSTLKPGKRKQRNICRKIVIGLKNEKLKLKKREKKKKKKGKLPRTAKAQHRSRGLKQQ